MYCCINSHTNNIHTNILDILNHEKKAEDFCLFSSYSFLFLVCLLINEEDRDTHAHTTHNHRGWQLVLEK